MHFVSLPKTLVLLSAQSVLHVSLSVPQTLLKLSCIYIPTIVF